MLDKTMKFSPWATGFILAFFSIGYLFFSPYPGFIHSSGPNDVTDIFSQSGDLELGDELLWVDGISMKTFKDNPNTKFLPNKEAGDKIDLIVLRNEQEISIEWVYLGITSEALLERITNLWPVAYLFWIVGVATHVLVRPRDTLWKLLITFNFITAVWFITGGTAKFHYFLTPFAFRASLWLSIPIYLHLHWNFPKPLFPLPWRFWHFAYPFFILIAVSQFIFLWAGSAHFFVFAITLVFSILFVVLHYILRPRERRGSRILLWAILSSSISVLAAISSAVFNISSSVITGILAGALFALPIMPFAYFYAIFRHRLGGLELRANRAISVYLFIVLAITVTSLIAPLLLGWLDFPGSSTIVTVSIGLVMALFAILGFRRFERFIEERVLGMPLPPEDLMHSYARQITGSLNRASLSMVLGKTILPSMLIREARLLYFDKQIGWQSILELGTADQHELEDKQIQTLRENAGTYIPTISENETPSQTAWIRLALPLSMEDEVIGIWLFGRRDPEDFYSQRDIVFLQTLANQTSIALSNIALAEDLRSLYMANVKRQEDEKEHIARELHDGVLNELAVLSMKMDGNVSGEFQSDYQNLTNQIRNTVQDLRPPMLSHGLHTAIEEFGETLKKRAGQEIEIDVTIPPSSHRFDEHVEAHLFRIVQQACENALRHANAQNIFVSGTIEDDAIELEISDNGKGFELDPQFNLAGLLSEKHYGIASMKERAELVGAELQIKSTSKSGTNVIVHWTP